MKNKEEMKKGVIVLSDNELKAFVGLAYVGACTLGLATIHYTKKGVEYIKTKLKK